MAQVLDRLFLWIFTIAVLVGTAGIIFQVTHWKSIICQCHLYYIIVTSCAVATDYNAHLTVMCINSMLGADKSCTDRSAILDIFDWLFLVTDIKLSHNSIHNKTARWKASNLQKQTILPTGMMFDDESLMGLRFKYL